MDEEKALPQPPNASNLNATQMLVLRACAAFYIVVFFYMAFFRSPGGLVNIYIHKDLEPSATSKFLPFPSAPFTESESESPLWSCRPQSAIDDGPASVITNLFELPTDSNGIYITSRGPSVSGNIKVEMADQSESEYSRNTLLVNVSTYYRDIGDVPSNDEGTPRVCAMKSLVDGFHGVGVFDAFSSYERQKPISGLQTNITITFPHTASVLYLNSFITEVDGFSQYIDDLSRSVHFKSVYLNSNKPVQVEALSADRVTIHTSDNPITGSFEVTDALDLLTSNAPIGVHVKMINDPGSRSSTGLKMKTSNSPITANLKLHSTEFKKINDPRVPIVNDVVEMYGNFSVNATTSNGPIQIFHTTAPVRSTVVIDAHSSNAPISVELHETYEGRYMMSSNIGRPNIQGRPDQYQDPEGLGRTRWISYWQIPPPTSMNGTVFWGKDPRDRGGENRGAINMDTTNAQVSMFV